MLAHERVAAEVRAEMARKRLSGVRAAKALGWKQNYISRRLTGRTPFDAGDLIAIAELLGVSVASFFPEPGEPGNISVIAIKDRVSAGTGVRRREFCREVLRPRQIAHVGCNSGNWAGVRGGRACRCDPGMPSAHRATRVELVGRGLSLASSAPGPRARTAGILSPPGGRRVSADYRPLSEIMPEALAEIEGIGGGGPTACLRCGQPVARPYELRPDGQASFRALYCDACIDRCHEATDFAHMCKVCAAPGEVYP